MKYITVAGFNSWRGKNTTDKANKIILDSGRDCEEFNYPGGRAGVLPGLLITRFGGIQAAARRLLQETKGLGPVVLVVHSNGLSVAAAALELMEKTTPRNKWWIKGVISYSGCLRGDWRFPEEIVVINNYYPDDWPLKIAEWRHKYLGHKLWGDFGKRPYRGCSATVFDEESKAWHIHKLHSHSDWFSDRCLSWYVMNSVTRMEKILG